MASRDAAKMGVAVTWFGITSGGELVQATSTCVVGNEEQFVYVCVSLSLCVVVHVFLKFHDIFHTNTRWASE